MKNTKLILVILVSLLAANPSQAFFLDFDKFFEKRHNKKQKVNIQIINDESCPVEIIEADVSDKGGMKFKELKDIYHTFTTKVLNTSDDKVITYQLAWRIRLPFRDYVDHSVIVDSIESLEAGEEQSINFKRDKYFRNDASYIVQVTKVELDGNKLWEAKDLEITQDRWAKAKSVLEETESNDSSSVEELEEDATEEDSDLEVEITE